MFGSFNRGVVATCMGTLKSAIGKEPLPNGRRYTGSHATRWVFLGYMLFASQTVIVLLMLLSSGCAANAVTAHKSQTLALDLLTKC